MPNYAPRVSLPYNDLSGVIQVWANSCAKLAVYEHESDEDIHTTHVHMIMIDCKYATPEQLKRDFYKMIETTRKGNELWGWTHKEHPNPGLEFITYMSKGKLRPVFLKNITPAEVEEFRALWVERKITPGSSSTETVKKMTKYEIVKAVECYFDAKRPKDMFGNPDKDYNPDDESILQCIRRQLIDNQQALGLYKVMDIYDAFIMYSNKTKFIHNCLNVLEKRLPRV